MKLPWQLKELMRKLTRKPKPEIHPSLPDNHLPQPFEIHMQQHPANKSRMSSMNYKGSNVKSIRRRNDNVD